VPGLDKERPQVNPLVRPLPILHLHDWRKMEVCLINFDKGEDDEVCLKFCNILNGVQLFKENYWASLYLNSAPVSVYTFMTETIVQRKWKNVV
jgi:hypothetical protein